MNHDDSHTINSPAEVSLKEALLKIQSGIRYLKSKWLTILIVGIFGGLVGLAYS